MITKLTNALMLLIVVAGLSCSPADDTKGIYKVGRAWHFKVAFFKDDMLVDSCSLKMATEKKGFLAMIMGQKSLNYRYQDCCSEPFYEKTGVSEKNGVFIHPPRLDCFAFTHASPMPDVSYPLAIGNQGDIDLVIAKSQFPGLSGITLKQYRQVTGKENYRFNGKTLSCYVTEGKNVSHTEKFGEYTNKFLFHEQYGFVKLVYYKPGNERVEFRLERVNF